MNPELSKEIYHLKQAFGSWKSTINIPDPFDFAFDLKGMEAEMSSEKDERASYVFCSFFSITLWT